MSCILQDFIFAEQTLNNYDLYKGTERENSFKMNLKPDFLPENQKIFALPYFLVPTDNDFILYKEEEKKFFDEKNRIEDKVFYSQWFGNCFCGVQILNNYVVDAEGFLYKCWEDIGIKNKAVYNLNDKKINNVLAESDYIIKSQSMFDKVCKNCFMFIGCQGGCPKHSLENKRICHVFKNDISQFLERHYEKSLKKDFIY